ncbi:hypothetical protein D9M68_657700 [compost metagenome]
MVAVLGVPVLALEPFVPGFRAGGVLQQHQLGELGRFGEGLLRHHAGRADRHHFLAEQADALGTGQGALAEEEGQVAAALGQGGGLQLVAQVQVDVRVAQAPALEPGNQPARAEGRRGGHPQHVGVAAVGQHVVGGHLHLGEDLAHLGEVERARRGQLQASAHPAEQQVLEQFLQLRHLLAHRALGQGELLGGAGETEVPGHRLEALQGGDRGHVAFQHRVSLVRADP